MDPIVALFRSYTRAKTFLKRKLGRTDESQPQFYFTNKNPAYAAYEIGDWTYGYPTVRSWGHDATLKIGKFCSIAQGVTVLLASDHRTDWVTTYPFPRIFSEAASIPGYPRSKGDVLIGNDVWIGYEALILSGVKIGNGAVIGARSVVTKDVAPYAIVAGNPAKQIRLRFDPPVIDRLQSLQWWHWPQEQLALALPDLCTGEIESFLAKYS